MFHLTYKLIFKSQNQLIIHPCTIYYDCFSCTRFTGGRGACTSCLWMKAGLHPGQVATLWQRHMGRQTTVLDESSVHKYAYGGC